MLSSSPNKTRSEIPPLKNQRLSSMASSQSSQSIASSNAQIFTRLPICGCDRTMRLYTSNTARNPNRRYWKCANYHVPEQSCGLYRWDDELKESDFIPRNNIRLLPQISDPVAEQVVPTQAAQNPRCSGCLYADKLMEAGNNKIEKLQLKLGKERARVQGLLIGLCLTLALLIIHVIVVHLV